MDIGKTRPLSHLRIYAVHPSYPALGLQPRLGSFRLDEVQAAKLTALKKKELQGYEEQLRNLLSSLSFLQSADWCSRFKVPFNHVG